MIYKDKQTYDYKAYLSSFLSFSEDIMILLSKKNSFIDFSDTAEKILGWNRTELKGQLFTEIYNIKKIIKPFSKKQFSLIIKEDVLKFNNSLVLGEQGNLNISWTIKKITNNDCLQIGLIIIGRIVSKEHFLEDQYKLDDDVLRKICDCIPGNFYWKNLKSEYLGCNQALLTMLKLNSYEKIVGKTDYDLWPDHAKKLIANDLYVISTGKNLFFEEKISLGDNIMYFTVIKIPWYDNNNNIIGVLGNSLNVTELRQTQDDLKVAKERAEAASKAKTEFIANMSHDIRTPLTGVIGMSKILEDNAENSKQKEYAHWLGESGDKLLNMLNGVLDVISADNVNEYDLHEEPFDLNNLIRDIYQVEHPSTILNGIDLILNIDEKIPSCLVSDHTKLQRILLNLIGNAIKFTKEGSITIKISLLKKNSKYVNLRFDISDTGIGIEPELQSHVFDSFFKITPSYKSIQTGHGVGLHIAQSYAHLLGGEIKLSSEVNVGTTFTFDLSLKIGDKKQIAKNILVPKELKKVSGASSYGIDQATELSKYKPNILLIEDNAIALRVLDNLVTQSYCKTTSAIDGEIGLELAKKNHFDLIITDLGLPNISGIELTIAIREYESLNNKSPIPIIGLTGHAADQVKDECIKAGMNAIFNKPMNLTILDNIKATYLARYANDESSSSSSVEKLGAGLPNNEKELFELNDFMIFDANLALRIIGEDKTLLKNILQEFIYNNLPNDIVLIKNAYSKQNWLEVEKLAHKIKGGVEYCGTVKLKYACQYLERYHKAGHTKNLEKLYQQMMDVKDETIPVIITWLDTDND